MEKGTLLYYWWEYKQPLWRFLKKLGIKLPHDPAIPLLCLYPEKTKTEKRHSTPMFTATLFTIARAWMPPKCPSIEKRIKKL